MQGRQLALRESGEDMARPALPLTARAAKKTRWFILRCNRQSVPAPPLPLAEHVRAGRM